MSTTRKPRVPCKRHRTSRVGLTALRSSGQASICACGAYRVWLDGRAVGPWLRATPDAHLLPSRVR